MSTAWLFGIVFGILLQAEFMPDFPSGTFTKKEAREIEKESDNIEKRIKVYQKASERMLKNLEKAVYGKEFQAVPEALSTWTTLITESLKDIQANLEPKKKRPKALVKYEIQVRKAIKDIRGLKIRAPVDQQDDFDTCISRAEDVRSSIVDILFNPEGDTDK
jgi:hypothetical protein